MINAPVTPNPRNGSFHYCRYQENGRIWICASVDWGGGHLDREIKDCCDETELHMFYSEVESEIVEGLYQTLKRRRNREKFGGAP